MPTTLAGGAERTNASDAATYASTDGDEFGIEALDSEDVSASGTPVTVQQLATDLRDTASCASLADDVCLSGTDASGSPVVVWFSQDRAAVMAAIAPDAVTLRLLLDAWNENRVPAGGGTPRSTQ